MACRSCAKHKSQRDPSATGYDPKTGSGKCPCGQSYKGGAPIDTCPKHWNAGYKTVESVLELMEKEKQVKDLVKELKSEDKEKDILEEVVADVLSEEKVEEKPKKKTKKKTAKKKTAKKKVAKK